MSLEFLRPSSGVPLGRQCYRLPDIDAEKGLSAYVGICNWFRFEETAGAASDAPTLLVESVKKAGSDLARRYPSVAGRIRSAQRPPGGPVGAASGRSFSFPSSCFDFVRSRLPNPASWLKRNVLKTENLELCVNDETASIGFLYFGQIDSAVVNGQTLSDPLDTRTGITRAAFLAATSSKRDPGGFFPYQSNDVVDRDDIPLCYVVVGKTSDNKFYGITLLVNHYICDGSTYFRLLREFDELIISHRQWSNQSASPKQLASAPTPKHFFSFQPLGELAFRKFDEPQAVTAATAATGPSAAKIFKTEQPPTGTLLGPLCDFALAAVRNPDLYRCVLVKLTDQELKKLKQNYANAVSTNDAVFALATELPAEEAAYVQHTAVSFPLDQRGVFSPFTDMLGNATRTVRANRASSLGDGSAASATKHNGVGCDFIRSAVRTRPADRIYFWQDLLKPLLFLGVRDRLVHSDDTRTNSSSSSASAADRHSSTSPLQPGPSRDSLQAPLLLNSATPGESPKATTRLDMDSRTEVPKTSSTSLRLPSLVPLSHLILSKLKSSLASVLVALFLPKKLPVALQHVSWAKVQYFPKGVLCQKPIQLDEDPRLVLRKMHHHGSLLTQFDSTVYTLRFCHRKAVVSHMLAEIAEVKSSVGGVGGAAAQEKWFVDIN